MGILDKNQYGATPYSLSHLFFELYGGWVSADFLSGLSKLFTDFIKDEGELADLPRVSCLSDWYLEIRYNLMQCCERAEEPKLNCLKEPEPKL